MMSSSLHLLTHLNEHKQRTGVTQLNATDAITVTLWANVYDLRAIVL